MMRKKHGKLAKLSSKEKVRRRAHNEARGRSPRAVRWEKDHVKKDHVDPTRVDGKSKSSRMVAALNKSLSEAVAARVAANKESTSDED